MLSQSIWLSARVQQWIYTNTYNTSSKSLEVLGRVDQHKNKPIQGIKKRPYFRWLASGFIRDVRQQKQNTSVTAQERIRSNSGRRVQQCSISCFISIFCDGSASGSTWILSALCSIEQKHWSCPDTAISDWIARTARWYVSHCVLYKCKVYQCKSGGCETIMFKVAPCFTPLTHSNWLPLVHGLWLADWLHCWLHTNKWHYGIYASAVNQIF